MNWMDLTTEVNPQRRGYSTMGIAEMEVATWRKGREEITAETLDHEILVCLSSSHDNRAGVAMCKALVFAKMGASTEAIVSMVNVFGNLEWRNGITAANELLSSRSLFGVMPKSVALRDRVLYLSGVSQMTPDNRGQALFNEMNERPQQVIEFIRTTSFAPMVLAYRNGTFDHELENFLFLLDAANVHLCPQVAMALWDKLVNETPEPVLYGLQFLNKLMELHPNWQKFAEFVFRDLFGGPRAGMVEPRSVVNHLRATNGLWPDLIVRTIEEMPEGSSQDCSSKFGVNAVTVTAESKAKKIETVRERWAETAHQLDAHLSKVDSQRVITKINELFFN